MSAARSILAWLIVAPCAAWAGLRVGGWEVGYPGVALMAVTPYALPLAVVGGVLAAALRRMGPVVVAAGTVLVLAALLAPRAVGGAEQSGGTRLRVMTLNTFEGRSAPAAVVDLVRQQRVDVLSLQELTPDAARALERAGLRRLLPHAVLDLSTEGGGFGILSRDPLRELPSTRHSVGFAALRPRGAVPVELVAVHARSPQTSSATERWRDDLRALPSASPGGPVQVLAGDFNATLDHSELRDVLKRGYRDAAAVVGAGLRPTWRGARSPWLTIDHVLVPERVAVRELTVHRIPGSDHRAVIAELALPRG